MVVAAPATVRLPLPPTGLSLRPFIYTDYTVVMLLSATRRFPEVFSAVRRLGPNLFPGGACQTLAFSIVQSTPPDIRPLGRTQREHLHDLTIEVNGCTLPSDLEWGMHLVRAQARRRYQPLLAAMLRWAADRVDDGTRLDYIHRLLDNAFDIALGDAPFDPIQLWEPTP